MILLSLCYKRYDDCLYYHHNIVILATNIQSSNRGHEIGGGGDKEWNSEGTEEHFTIGVRSCSDDVYMVECLYLFFIQLLLQN